MDRFRFGRSVRELRQRRHWRQSDLGDRIGVSRSVIGRIERGVVANVPYGRLLAVADALDGRLDLDFRWRGEALDRLVDERHTAIVDELVGLFRSARWDVAVEVTFSIYGERGSIDVFAFHPIQHVVAVNEVKASVGEAGNTVLGVDRKSRLAPQIARGAGRAGAWRGSWSSPTARRPATGSLVMPTRSGRRFRPAAASASRGSGTLSASRRAGSCSSRPGMGVG
jgi:transcriptional regulator with XRE-family HTH domain